ncbi:MAG: FAD binding domain-containing protein [Archangiaceae bacterium]|nr:FAD binding domain-containing protein [Archangiaceae bacterium]
MNAFEWVAPKTTEQVSEAARAQGAVLKAGGVDLLDRLKNNLEAPSRVVSLQALKGLGGIAGDAKAGLELGALVTLAQLAGDARVRAAAPKLAEACWHVATPQVRNMATLGGNLAQRTHCWYFRSEHDVCRRKGGSTCFAQRGDNEHHALFGNGVCASVHASTVAPMLLALEAVLTVENGKSSRQLRLEDFFVPPEKDLSRENVLQPGDVITRVRVPPSRAKTGYLKQTAKESFDWPLAVAAVAVELDGATCKRAAVVLGAAAPVPLRARAAEAALVGKPFGPDSIREAAKAAVQGASPLSGNGYRVPVFEVVVRRALEQALEAKS